MVTQQLGECRQLLHVIVDYEERARIAKSAPRACGRGQLDLNGERIVGDRRCYAAAMCLRNLTHDLDRDVMLIARARRGS